MIRFGEACILAEANDQFNNGLAANFGVRDAGLPAILESDIDVSDNETLRNTLRNARKELASETQQTTDALLRCIAKRLRPNGKTWVRCEQKCIRGEQYCPLHLQVSLKLDLTFITYHKKYFLSYYFEI